MTTTDVLKLIADEQTTDGSRERRVADIADVRLGRRSR